MAVVGEDIPRELKLRRQWVAALITPDPDRPGKSNKRPLDPRTGGAASTTDAGTWGALDEAVAAAERLPAGTGAVGFVFTADDPYCGVDFDACYKDGRTSPEVLDWVRQLDSYTEKSISGLGLHVICKGVLPPGGRRKGGIEMYDRGRFFVMTGKAVPGLLWVNERNEALAKLHKAVFGEAQDTPAAVASPVAVAAPPVLAAAAAQADVAAVQPSDLAEIPPLPAAAQLDPCLAAGAAPWLDAYIAFSRAWAPRAFDDFHEAVGLWVLSTVAARRVVTHLGPPRFTNLYIANVARSSIWTKTTAAAIGGDVLAEAGLRFLLAPDECTPQAYVVAAANTGQVDWERLSPEQDAQTRLEIGFAAQRGWAYDEFGMKVDAMMRDNGPMAEFRGLLRRFDDCPERYEYVTTGRGSAVMDRPYLALLASMTPADLARHARAGGPLWQDGFWARFAFVAPPIDATPALGRFPPGRRMPPPDLVRGLREWHEWLGVPEVTVTERTGEDSKVKTKEWDVFINRSEPRECTLGAGVEDVFYRYHDALTQLITEGGNPDWDGNYSRFAEKALRVASLLASIENRGAIEMRHWARGQAVAERWRAGLHHVYAAVNSSAVSPQVLAEEKILRIVRKLGQATVRDVLTYGKDLTSLACSTTMEAMAKVGVLEVVRKTRSGTLAYAPARDLDGAG